MIMVMCGEKHLTAKHRYVNRVALCDGHPIFLKVKKLYNKLRRVGT